MKQRPMVSAIVGSLALAMMLAGEPAKAQNVQPAAADDGFAQNFAAEHDIGRRFHFDAANLPAPKTGPIVTDRSLIIPYSEQTLQVPPGFAATPFATGLVNPRRLLVLANGDILVAEQSAG